MISKVVETLELFVEVNVKLENNSLFRIQATECMANIIKFFKEVQVKCLNGKLTKSMYTHFITDSEEDRIFSDQPQTENKSKFCFWPIFDQTQENLARLSRFKIWKDSYIAKAEEAIKPVRTCNKYGRTSCRCCFKSIFGDPTQMGIVLAKTFEGQHRWIPSGDVLLDAMFFPSTNEVPDDSLQELEYKKRPTFIFCNPNAMFYQHMINYPHAFYLRFFLQKGINVLVWNYRGYGLTKAKSCCFKWKNSPSPDNFKEDGESVLNYLNTVIGVRGKLGVYGRSLGGIATCHLAKQVDMVIADRSFSNLHEVAERKFHGESARVLFKLATGGWRATNEIDFVKPRSCKDDEDDR